MKIARLTGCKNFVGKRKKFIFNAFINLKPMERFEDRGDMCGFRIKDRDEMRVLSGVVYRIKSSGPRTEPWGTPQRQVWREEKVLLHFTRKQRDDR